MAMTTATTTREWFIYVPGEGDWPISYAGASPAEARAVYLRWAGRARLPRGARIWSRSAVARPAAPKRPSTCWLRDHPQHTYVYTLSAARARLRRGRRSVLVFLPNDGRLVKATPATINKVAKLFARCGREGRA